MKVEGKRDHFWKSSRCIVSVLTKAVEFGQKVHKATKGDRRPRRVVLGRSLLFAVVEEMDVLLIRDTEVE